MGNERWDRGVEKIRELSGPDALEQVEALSRGAPDLGRWIVEFIFGEIYSRPGLSLRDRQIANVAALTALGTAPGTLAVHINGALNAGVSEQEVLEIVLQMAAYAGFPRAASALAVARGLFEERSAS